MDEIDFESDSFEDIVKRDDRYNAKAYALLADVVPDFDGEPNAADAAAILRYVVGLIDTFEIEAAE